VKRFKLDTGAGGEGRRRGYLSTTEWNDVCASIVIVQRVKQWTGMMYVTAGCFSRRRRQICMDILTHVEGKPSITQINGTCLSRKILLCLTFIPFHRAILIYHDVIR
jgi:hypothetical protein